MFLKKKFKDLMIPWLSYSIIIYIIFAIASFIKPIQNLLNGSGYELMSFGQYIIESLNGNNPYAFHLWFIYILFIIQVACFLMWRIYSSKYKITLMPLIGIFLVLLFISTFIYSTDNVIQKAVYRLPWFLGGIIFGQLEIEKIIMRKSFGLISGLIGIVCLSFCILLGDHFGFNIGLRFVRNFIGIPAILSFLIFVAKHGDEKRYIVKDLVSFGRNSFSIYLLHQPFCCAFLGTVLLKVLPNSLLAYIIVIIICTFFSLVVPRVICFLAKRIHLDNQLSCFLGIKFLE